MTSAQSLSEWVINLWLTDRQTFEDILTKCAEMLPRFRYYYPQMRDKTNDKFVIKTSKQREKKGVIHPPFAQFHLRRERVEPWSGKARRVPPHIRERIGRTDPARGICQKPKRPRARVAQRLLPAAKTCPAESCFVVNWPSVAAPSVPASSARHAAASDRTSCWQRLAD